MSVISDLNGVILAFDADDGSTWYFLGTSREAVVDDAKSGTTFGQVFTGFHPVALADVHRHGFMYLDDAIRSLTRSIRDGRSLSYLIGILDEKGQPTERAR